MIRTEIATTSSAASETRKPSAPAPLPSRRPAPLTTSLTTRQAKTRADQADERAGEALDIGAAREQEAGDEARSRAARIVIRPRAEPCVPVVPASIPIAMPMPSSRQMPEKDPRAKT